ncbi:hypothetical protein O5D80_001720 [Batrachochytrium dendrobatidis]|nr:hypothetical protein O5D80_001720 [Batrachochytrium dendrobatidis]
MATKSGSHGVFTASFFNHPTQISTLPVSKNRSVSLNLSTSSASNFEQFNRNKDSNRAAYPELASTVNTPFTESLNYLPNTFKHIQKNDAQSCNTATVDINSASISSPNTSSSFPQIDSSVDTSIQVNQLDSAQHTSHLSLNMSLQNATQSDINNSSIFSFQSNCLNHEIICDIAAALFILRTTLIFQADSSGVSLTTLRNFLLGFVPFELFVYQSMQLHHEYLSKGGIGEFAFTTMILMCMFGMGWTVPSLFALNRDSPIAFLIMLVCGKFIFSVTKILLSVLGSSQPMILAIKSILDLLPVGFWIAAVWVVPIDRYMMFLILGVCTDVASCVVMDGLDIWSVSLPRCTTRMAADRDLTAVSNQRHAAMDGKIQSQKQLAAKGIVYTTALIIVGTTYMFPYRLGTYYPDTVLTIKFNIFNFLVGSSGLIILFSLHAMHVISCDWKTPYVFNFSKVIASKSLFSGKKASFNSILRSTSTMNNYEPTQNNRSASNSIQNNSAVSRSNLNGIHGFKSQFMELLNDTQRYYTSLILTKCLHWFHMTFHIILVVFIAAIQLQLTSMYKQFMGAPVNAPRFPVDMSISNDFAGLTTQFNATGVDYLDMMIAFNSNSTLVLKTSRLASLPSWTPISVTLVCAGLCVIIIACVGVLLTWLAALDNRLLHSTVVVWGRVWHSVGRLSVFRITVGILIVVYGIVEATCQPSGIDACLFFGLAGIVGLMSIFEEIRKQISIKNV